MNELVLIYRFLTDYSMAIKYSDCLVVSIFTKLTHRESRIDKIEYTVDLLKSAGLFPKLAWIV